VTGPDDWVILVCSPGAEKEVAVIVSDFSIVTRIFLTRVIWLTVNGGGKS
jgi:hypothetical protein